MPTVLIDADSCPVVDLTIRLCKGRGMPVLILCGTAHRIEREGAETLVFDKGADSVDFALVNRVSPGDIVVTQDYGLASMCLARRARVLNQNGLEYTADNVDGLLGTAGKTKNSSALASTRKGPVSAQKSRMRRLQKCLKRLLITKNEMVGHK